MENPVKPLTDGFVHTTEGKLFEQDFERAVEDVLEEYVRRGCNTYEMAALASDLIHVHLATWRIRLKLEK